jgi:hypothetical protein
LMRRPWEHVLFAAGGAFVADRIRWRRCNTPCSV